VLSIIRDCLDALLHPSARYDALTRARHRAFMAPRLLGSLAAFAAFPIYLAMRGAPSAIEVAAFAWLIAPILLSWFLSRTGRYEGAHVLSSLALAGLIMAVALTTGGIESFAAIWLVVVPLEAALSASRRVAAFASALALSCAGLLILLGQFDLLPIDQANAAQRGMFMAFGVASATLYAAGLAFGAESLARTSVSLLSREEERYRLLARNMSDVISRHQRNGAVQFISPAAETMLGTLPAQLLGHGLFDRVHVADRPAYLTALSDAARGANGSGEISKLPDSILDMSRMPLTTDSRCWPESLISCAYSRRRAASSIKACSCAISSEKPIMALSGVRSSWLMVARKRVLAASAASAALRA